MKLFVYLVLPAALFATACGGGGGASVSIVGDEPADQAAEIADASCSRQQECGAATIDCQTDPETQMLECIGTIEEVDEAECIESREATFLSIFENCELTAEDEGAIEDCINALLAQSCISQAEIEEYAAEVEAGNEPEPLREYPEVCVEADAIIEGCSPQ